MGAEPPPTIPPETASEPVPGENLGVRVIPPVVTATTIGVWAVERDGKLLPHACFEGAGAEGRANGYVAWLRTEIREGRDGAKLPRGKCALGHPCDRDLAHVLRLSDLPVASLARLVLCAEHGRQARGEAPVPVPMVAAPPGRRRKAVPS